MKLKTNELIKVVITLIKMVNCKKKIHKNKTSSSFIFFFTPYIINLFIIQV